MRPCQSDEPWLVIVNPNSGKKKGARDWGKIAQLLDKNFKYTALFTEKRGHAVKLVKDEIFTVSIGIGIGVYSGGGMKQRPHSIPNDGLFDITIIKKMRKIGIIKSLPLLYNGKILEHPKVVSFRGTKINIEC